MRKEGLLRLGSALVIVATFAGCSSETPTGYDKDPFVGVTDNWQVTRIAQNQFIVDGAPFSNDLNTNTQNAENGIRIIQNQLGCKITSMNKPKETSSAFVITVSDPNCIVNGFKALEVTVAPNLK